MPRYVFQKLVRDKLPEVYAELHQVADIKRIQGEELWRELKRKLVEEATELPENIGDKEALTAELADVLRVIKDAATYAGIDFVEVEKADAKKTAKKGGFLKGAYVESLTLRQDDKWNEYYRAEPRRFPEIFEESPSAMSIIRLSEELAELGKIDRATFLPGGRRESDSHHSFSLTLIAYDICTKYCPELDTALVTRYALVHDLIEIITGDEDTLKLDHQQLAAKHLREKKAFHELERRLSAYPSLLDTLRNYERLDTPEAAAVYVLDKSCTIWTQFWDKGKRLHARGMETRADIDTWYQTQTEKLQRRLKVMPPQVILDVFTDSYAKMREELFEQ